ncbi:hypothetical protein GH714_016465 [Hevea brasiliensis]|uniref:Uncharacterized protein n=1 Tax=Hevea brasiliensis TaxID=3981 RepID=A0A6A6NHT1_HEVBR|nr:hypothetical protein GH714_016465 [Hevea brasiliensis]
MEPVDLMVDKLKGLLNLAKNSLTVSFIAGTILLAEIRLLVRRAIDIYSGKKRGLTDLSYAWPPLLNQCNGSAIGLTVRKSNVTASMAQSVSGFVVQPCSDRIGQCFNTFGQIVCQLPKGIKLSLSGVHQMRRLSSLGALTIPVAFLKHHKALETMIDASAPLMEPNTLQAFSTGSIAMNVETELDENTRIGGWIEMNKSNPKQLQWAVNFFNDSEDES